MRYLFATLLTVLLSCAVTLSQDIAIADGSSSGIYKLMFDQMKAVSPDLNLTEVPSSGAIENLDKLVNNEADCAFMHSDVIYYRAKSDENNLSNLKTLLALFPEDVHFLVRNEEWSYGGTWGIGKKAITFNTIADLATPNQDLVVGAAGGGYITAQVIRTQGELNFKVQQYNSGAEVMAALNKKEIACALFVGAAPLPNLKDLGPEYKLLAVDDATMGRLKNIYRPTTIVYTKMGPQTVRTVAPECLLVARVVKTPKFVAGLKALRKHFYDNLDELKEKRGSHKAWQKVSADNHGKWEWYDFGK